MGISIRIQAGLDEASSSVSAAGSELHLVTETERKSFGLDGKRLKKAINAYFGKTPDEAHLHSHKIYRNHPEFKEVQTVIMVKSATIVAIETEPVIIAANIFTNNSKKQATYDCSISQQVTNTTESNWSHTESVEMTQKINYQVGTPGTGAGGESSFSYNHAWGEGGSEAQSVTVGSTAGVTVTLDPGESVEAQLTASRGVMTVRIEYEAHLTGDAAAKYENKYKGDKHHGLPIHDVMQAYKLPNSLTFTEEIEVGFYANSQILLIDAQKQVKATYVMAEMAAIASQPGEE